MCLIRKMVQNSKVSLVVFLVVGVTAVALSANSAPVHNRPIYKKKAITRHAPPVRYVRALPYGYRTFVHGGLTYYYADGHYYHHSPDGYMVITAPVGATVQFLPAGAVSVTIGKVRYYRVAGVYYQKSTAGYRIVNPVVVEAPANDLVEGADRVRVSVSTLNVRSGPGTNRQVINTVRKGNVLLVLAEESGWYYVQLPDGTSGWVMKVYVTVLEPRPVG